MGKKIQQPKGFDETVAHKLSECISKITVTDNTPMGLLADWIKYDIHAQVFFKTRGKKVYNVNA